MPKPEFSRSLHWMREGTERRRKGRSRRKHTYILLFGGFLLALVLALPSLLSFTPIVHNLVSSTAVKFGWQVSASEIRIGWITPLSIRGVEGTGIEGNTRVSVESVDLPLTLLDLLRGTTDLGTIDVQAPRLETQIYSGGSKLEDDLALFLQPSDGGSSAYTAKVAIRDAAVKIVAEDSGKEWRVDQLQSSIAIDVAGNTLTWEGVVTDSSGISGAIQGGVAIPSDAKQPTSLQLEIEGLPLSLADLLVIRLPDATANLPERWSGNASGILNVALNQDGSISLTAQPVDLRNLLVQDSRITGGSNWKIGHALLEGRLDFHNETLRADSLTLQSDVGNAKLHGEILLAAISEGRYLDSMYGDFSTDFELSTLTQATPGLIPLREGVAIQQGRIRGRVQGRVAEDNQYRSSWNLQTEAIRATTGNTPIVLQPLTAELTLRPIGNWVSAEHLHIQSAFGKATASGDLRNGQADFDLDFGRLAGMLESIIELPPSSLQGATSGSIRWSVATDNTWSLSGNAVARNLVIQVSPGSDIRTPSLDLALDAKGVIQGDSLERLDRAELRVTEPNQAWTLGLTESVARPDGNTLLPLRLQGSGKLVAIAALARPWLPASVTELTGDASVDVQARVAARSGRLSSADVTLSRATVVYNERRYEQDTMKGVFRGDYLWPDNLLKIQELTLSGTAVSLACQGEMKPGATKLESAFRADLSRLQGAVSRPGTAVDDAWQYTGMIEGRANLANETGGIWAVYLDVNGRNLRLLQPPAIANSSGIVGPIPQTQASQTPQLLWEEATAALKGNVAIEADWSRLNLDQMEVTLPWLVTTLRGQVTMNELGHVVLLQGPAKIDMRMAGQRITSLLGEPVQLTGTHQTELKFKMEGGGGRDQKLDLATTVGWQTASLAGVTVGATTVPLRVTEHVVFIDPATVPLQTGQLHVHGELHYRPGVLWFEQRPGRFAEGIALTPEMCRTWLKYMMPLVADATEVSGAFSVDLAECIIIPSDTNRSRVVGTINVEGVTVGPGPLSTRMLSLVDQIQMAAKGLQGQPPTNQQGKQWVRMEPQAVEFAMISGQVSHQRILTRLGKAELISSGSVSLDGRLNLQMQVPLHPDWLGSNLASLAGRPIVVPVTGTLSRPGVDAQAVAAALGQLGTTALQSSAENYIQKQFDRQLQKLLGR